MDPMTYEDAKLFCSAINVTIDGATMHAQMIDFTGATYRLALKGIKIINLNFKGIYLSFIHLKYCKRVT